MNFFKGQGQGGKKSSLFGGMKVKGPVKEQKPKTVQTEHNLSIDPPVEIPQQRQQKPTVIQEPKQESIGSDHAEKQIKNIEKTSTTLKKQEKSEEQECIEMKQKPVSQMEDKQSQNQDKQEKKYSASQAGYNFEKQRDRKRSNPFLNQIKKNTKKEHSVLQEQTPKIQPKKITPQPPKKNLTSDREELLEQLNQGHLRIINYFTKQKLIKQSIIQIASSLGDMKDDLNETMQKQFKAVELQEYEQADKYQNKIDTLQTKIEEKQIQLNCQQQEFYKHEYEQINVLKAEGNEHKKIVRKIKLVEMQLNEESSKIHRTIEEFKESEQIKIQNENKKISRLENDIKYQSEQLISFEKQFNEDLDSRRDPLLFQLNQSNLKKQTLENQIQQLEATLAKKKKELSEVNSGLKEIKKQINQIQQNFKEEGIKLNQRKNKIKKLQEEKGSLSSHLSEIEANLSKEAQEQTGEANKLIEEARSLGNLSKKIESDSLNFEDKIEHKKVKVDTFVHNTKNLKKFQQEHKETKQKIKQLEFKKANVAAEANKLQDRRVALKNMIPKLESEQKALANSKNFKGAGMKKTEIKEANQEMEVITKKIEDSFVEQKRVEEEISKIESEQQKFIDEENQIRKNLAISQFNFNQDKYKDIQNQIKWLQSEKRLKISQEEVKAYLNALTEEAESLEEEIKYIGEEYDLPVNLKSESDDQENNLNSVEEKPEQVDRKPASRPSQTGEEEINHQENQEDEANQEIKEEKQKTQQPNDEMKAQKDNEQSQDKNNEQSQDKNNEQSQDKNNEQSQDKNNEQSQDNADDEQDTGYVPLQLD